MKDPTRQKIARAIVWRLIDTEDSDPTFMDLKEKFICRNTRANLCVIGSIVIATIVGTLRIRAEINPIWFLLLFIFFLPLLYYTFFPIIVTDEEEKELAKKNQRIEAFDRKHSDAMSAISSEQLMID